MSSVSTAPSVLHARPQKLEQALQLMHEHPYRLLAGGTDFYPSSAHTDTTSSVLDITAIDALRGLVKEDDNSLTINALCRWSDIVNAELPPAFRALQLAAVEVGSVQIQNRATLVGNLCNASPAADGVPPLLCLDAMVNLASVRGNRSIPLSDFIQGNRRTNRSIDEMVVSISIPEDACRGQSDFIKLGARKYLVISIAMVASRLVVENGVIKRAAVSVGSCSEVAMRLPEVESALVGQLANAESIAAALPHKLTGLSPIDDVRSSAGYRNIAALSLVRKSLQRCLDDAAQR